MRVYPNLRAEGSIDYLNVFGVDCSDLHEDCAQLAPEMFRWLWNSYTPQQCAILAAYYGYTVDQIADILRRRVVQERGLGWSPELVRSFAEKGHDRCDRFPEYVASIGMAAGHMAPIFPLNEEVATTLLEAGATKQQAIAVLDNRSELHKLHFTAQELDAHVTMAARVLRASDDEYQAMWTRMVCRSYL